MEQILVDDLSGVKVVGFDLYTKGSDGQDVVLQDALVKIASGEMEIVSGGEAVSITDIISASNLNLDQVENVFLENVLTENGKGAGDGVVSEEEEVQDESELRLQQLVEEAARLEALQEEIAAKEAELQAREAALAEEAEAEAEAQAAADEAAANELASSENLIDGSSDIEDFVIETQEESVDLPDLASEESEETAREDLGTGVKKVLPQPQIQQVTVSSSSSSSSSSSKTGDIVEEKEDVKLTLALASESDSATVGDFITNINSGLNFTGTANAGASITLTLNDVVETTTADGTGAWSVAFAGTLADASYPVLVSTTTTLGGTASLNKTLVIDTVAPTQPDASLSADSDTGESDTDTITFDATAKFEGQGEAGTTIELTIDDRTYKGDVGSDGSWSITVTTALTDEVDKEYQVVSVDDAGNRSPSFTNTLTVDTVINLEGGLSDLRDSNVVGDEVTNITWPTFNGAGEAGAKVVLTLNGMTWNTTVSNAGTWSFDPEMQLEDGRYEYTLVAEDVAGNTKTLNNTLIIDTQPPELTARLDESSDSGDSRSDKLTNDVSPKFSGTTEAGITVEFYEGEDHTESDEPLFKTTSDSNGDWFIQFDDSLPQGIYKYHVVATDLAGNQTVVSDQIEVDTETTLTGGLDAESDSGALSDDNLTKVQTPTFSGTGEADATVVLTINGQNYSTKVDASGNWAVTVSDVLDAGDYDYSVAATDKAGNQATTENGSITVDISTDVTARLDASEDTGRSDADAVTKNTLPMLSGTGEAGATLVLTVNDEVQATDIVVDASGNWQYAFPSVLADGTYSYQVDATDLAGNTASTTASFVVDTTIPTPFTAVMDSSSDSGSLSDDYLTRVTMPTFSGTSEADSDVTLNLYQDDELVFTDLVRVGSDESWALAVTEALADGDYRFELFANDAAGNQTASVSHALTIDTVAELSGGLSADSDSGVSDSDDLTKNATPTFSGEGEEGAQVSLTIDGETYSTTVDSDKKWSITVPTDLVDGTYEYTLNTVDLAGNTLEGEAVLTGSIEVDTQAPEPFTGRLAAQSDSGSDQNDQLTNETQPVFEGTVEVGSTVTLTIAGQSISANATVDENGNWQVTVPTELADSDYQYTLTAEDAAGNTTELTGDFKVDTVTTLSGGLLAESDSGDSSSDTITNITTPSFGGTGEVGATVVLTINEQAFSAVVDAAGDWTITVNTDLPEGDIDYTLVATDLAGNTAQQSGQITVDTQTSVTANLSAQSDSGESNSDAITNNTTPFFNGQGEAGASITLAINGENYITKVTEAGTWSVQVTDALPEGDHTFTVTAVDVAGNTDVTSDSITIDTKAPTPFDGGLAADSDTGASDSDNITKNTTPFFSGNGEAGVRVTLDIAGNVYETTVDNNGEWNLQVTNALADSVQDYRILATDVAGNESEFTGKITIDTQVTLTGGLNSASDTGSSSTDTITNDTTPTFSGTGEVGAAIVVTLNQKPYSTTVGDDGNWTVVANDVLAEGDYNYSIKTTDIAGNTASKTGQFSVDTTAPLNFSGGVDLSSDTGRASDDGITQTLRPTFSGAVEVGSTVSLLIAGKTYKATVDDQGEWALTLPTALSVGEHEYTLSATDVAGNTSTIDQSITVDNETSLTGGLAQTSDTGTSNSDGYTKDTTPIFSGTAEALADVVLSINGKTYSERADQSGNWSIEVSDTLIDADYIYSITSTDIAGNQDSVDGSITIDATTFLTAKLATSSDTGASSSDTLTKDDTPTFSGTAEVGATVTLIIQGATYTATANSSQVWSIDVTTPLEDGEIDYTVSAVDKAGNEETFIGQITLDTQAPEFAGGLSSESDSGESSTDGITNDSKPAFSGTGEAGASVSFVVAEETYPLVIDANGEWQVSVDTTLADGSYDYSATATDSAGNVSTLSGSILVDTAIQFSGRLDAASDTGVSNSDKITQSTTPTFSGTGDSGDKVSLLINGVTYNETIDSDGSWSITLDQALSDAAYPYTLTASDTAGNQKVFKDTITVDTTMPNALTGGLAVASDTGSSFSDGITKITAPVFSGTVEQGAQVTLVINGLRYDATVDDQGAWQVDNVTALPDGEHSYQVIATDDAGNERILNKTVTVDTKTTLTGGLDTASDTGDSSTDGLTKNSQPEFSGAAEAGAEVALTIGDQTYSTTVDESGAWLIPVTNELDDGQQSYTIVSTDIAGNQKTLSGSIDVDTVTTLTARLQSSSDSGLLNSDGVTNVTTPTFTGTGETGATISVNVEGVPYSTEVSDSGTWSLQLETALDEGDYSLTFIATDTAGNTTQKIVDITVDTLDPTPLTAELATDSDTGVSDTDGITQNLQPIIQGTGEAGARIAVIVDGSTLSTTVTESGEWSVQPSELSSDGTFAYQVTQTDLAGNTSTLASSFVLDTSAPTIQGGLIQLDDSGLSNTDGITNVNTPTFKGTAEKSAAIALQINGDSYTTTADSNGNWTIEATDALPEGNVDYSISAEDVAGNSSTINGTMTIDTLAPTGLTAALEQDSDSGSLQTDKLTKVTTPYIGGLAETGSTVVVTINGQQYSTVATDGEWRVQVTTSLPDGNHAFSVMSTDTAGNSSAAVTGQFDVDTSTFVSGKLAASSDTGSSNSDNLTQNDTPTFVGTTEVGASVVLNINENSYNATVDALGNWTLSIPASQPLPEGETSYTITATDLAGNTAVTNGSVIVDQTAPTPFTIELASSSDSTIQGDSLTNINTPTIQGSGEPNATVELYVGNQTQTTTVDSDGNWSITLNTLADGLSTIEATATDAAGNESTLTLPITIDTVTTVTGAMSADSDKGFLNTDEITNVTTPTFNGTGEAGATLVLTINGNPYETTIGTDGNWSVEVTDALPEGDHDYSITSTDVAGNTATDTGTATIDLTDPENFTGGLDANSDTGTSDSDKLTNDTTPTFTGTGEVGSKVTLNLDGQNTTVTVDGDGNWSITPDAALATAGDYDYTLTAQDVAGNTKQISDTFELDLVATLSGRLDADSDNGFSDSDNLTNMTTPTFTGAAEAGTVVTLTINGKPYSTTVAAGQTTWSITVPESDALTDTSGDTESGTDYNYTISAVDYAGNTATPVTGTLTLDTSNPTPLTGGLKADADNDTGRSETDTITNNRLPTFEGTVEEGAKVTLKINGGVYQATVDGTTWTYTLQAGEILPANGTLNYTIEAEDSAGNISTLSRSITVDTTNPAVTSALAAESDSGVSNTDNLTNDTTPTLKGTADVNADIVVTISSTGKTYETQADTDGNWNITVPAGEALSEGEQNYTVKATDVAGNTTTLNGDRFTVDTTAPTTLTTDLATASDSSDSRNATGTNSDGITNDTTPTLTGAVEAGSTVKVTLNGSTFDATVTGTSWSYTPSADLPQGTYDYSVVATDAA
ncbi:Ig-like domain repeat protein, partial [Marinomonas sp. A79]